jgi:hypothetical protein
LELEGQLKKKDSVILFHKRSIDRLEREKEQLTKELLAEKDAEIAKLRKLLGPVSRVSGTHVNIWGMCQ